MKKWIEIKGFGVLYIEIVLVTFDIPLLFTCFDEFKNRYLVLCVDEEIGQYLLVKSNSSSLLKMLNNEVPMEQTFKDMSNGRFMLVNYNSSEKKFEFDYLNIEQTSKDMLPDEGAFFELSNQKIKDYITKLEKEETKNVFCCTVESHYINTNKVFIYNESNIDKLLQEYSLPNKNWLSHCVSLRLLENKIESYNFNVNEEMDSFLNYNFSEPIVITRSDTIYA